MEIKINIEKKYLWLLILAIVAVGVVVAFNTFPPDPAVMGHSLGEVLGQDADNDGIVDNAEKLEGKTLAEVTALTGGNSNAQVEEGVEIYAGRITNANANYQFQSANLDSATGIKKVRIDVVSSSVPGVSATACDVVLDASNNYQATCASSGVITPYRWSWNPDCGGNPIGDWMSVDVYGRDSVNFKDRIGEDGTTSLKFIKCARWSRSQTITADVYVTPYVIRAGGKRIQAPTPSLQNIQVIESH